MSALSVREFAVIGLGPAGVAAAIQARRDGLDVVAFGDERPGGLVRAARKIINLPGFYGGCGRSLGLRMEKDLSEAKIDVRLEQVTGLTTNDDGLFVVETPKGKGLFIAVGVFTGTRPIELPLPLRTLPCVFRDIRGLSHRHIRGQEAIVVGGGDAALDTALSLMDRGAMVTIIVRKERPIAAYHLVSEAIARGVSIRCNTVIEAACPVADGAVSFMLSCKERLTANIIVACIGRVARTELLEHFNTKISQVETGIPGLFVGGDVLRSHGRFIASAMSDGQKAALLAGQYIEEVRCRLKRS